MNLYTSFYSRGLLAALLHFSAVAFCVSIHAQAFHGASIQKNPVGPDGTARAHVGDTITATVTIMNLDEFLDTVTITNIVDVVHHASGDVTSANLLAMPVTLDSLFSTFP